MLIKIVNTPLDKLAALVVCVINWMYCSWTGIYQVQLDIWPVPDLAEFFLNGQIAYLPKSGTTLINCINVLLEFVW